MPLKLMLSTRWRSVVLILALTSTIAIAVVLVKRFLFPDTLESAAHRVNACYADGDANCLYDYVIPQEIQAYHLSPEKLNALLNVYVLPSIKDLKPAAPEEADAVKESGAYLISQKLQRSDGVIVGRGITVMLTEDGIRAPMLISTLIDTALRAHGAKPEDRNALESMARGISQDKKTLEELGFSGYLKPRDMRVYSWDELRSDIIQRLKKAGLEYQE